MNLLAAIQGVMPHNSQTSGLYSTYHLKHKVPYKQYFCWMVICFSVLDNCKVLFIRLLYSMDVVAFCCSEVLVKCLSYLQMNVAKCLQYTDLAM